MSGAWTRSLWWRLFVVVGALAWVLSDGPLWQRVVVGAFLLGGVADLVLWGVERYRVRRGAGLKQE